MDGCLHFDRIGHYPTRRYVVICKVYYSDAIKISKTVDQLYSDTSPNPPMEWSKCCLRRCRIIILDTKSFFEKIWRRVLSLDVDVMFLLWRVRDSHRMERISPL